MLNKIALTNFGPQSRLDWRNPGMINLVIGRNGTGKTFLLKALYSAIRTLEEYNRGHDQRTAREILAEKLYWTFQPGKIGDLVTRGAEGMLSCDFEFDGKRFSYSFGRDTTRQISYLENHVPPRESNSIFLPAKEVLSLHQIILKSREQDQSFGFDDTYLDLARALRISPRGGKNYREFAWSRKKLEEILDGKIEFDDTSQSWLFKRGKQKYPIGVAAEGIKKIAILDTLFRNRFLDTNSIIFFDEPESALHPEAISKLLDIVSVLSERGLQFFLASHSYFVVKKLFLIAQKKNIAISVLSIDGNRCETFDLGKGMPNNPIIAESIRLYKEEVGMVLE